MARGGGGVGGGGRRPDAEERDTVALRLRRLRRMEREGRECDVGGQ